MSHKWFEEMCGCEWDNGTWFPCALHMCPHEEHRSYAPGCPECEAEVDATLKGVDEALGMDNGDLQS